MLSKNRFSLLASSLLLALMPSADAAVTFEFDYSDPSAALWSPEARAVLDNAGKKVASYFVNYTATVNIAIYAYNDPTDVTLAYAGANFDLTGGNPGFDNPGAVANKILSNGGFDENGSEPDGYIGRNLGRLDVGYGDIVGAGEVDFTTAMMHELGHTLGIFGNISQAGQPAFDGYYVPYSQFLSDSSGQRIVTFNTASQIWEVDVPLWLETSTGGPGNGMYFTGTNAMRAYGDKPVPLYSPADWREGSSLYHLDEDTFGRSLMTPILGHGPGQHGFSPIEIGMLKDIGYSLIVPEPGSMMLSLLGLSLGLRRRRSK